MSATLLSKHGLARQLDLDPRTLTRRLRAARIEPTFIGPTGGFYAPAEVSAIRRTLRAQVPATAC